MKEMIILASNSPRRIELLKSCDIDFEVIPHRFDESSLKLKDPVEYAKNSAFLKANSLCEVPEFKNRYILGVDTIVVFRNKILGKPSNKNEAEEFVRMMSGKSNTVISGISLINKSKNKTITRHSK
jgi:septum formation protein